MLVTMDMRKGATVTMDEPGESLSLIILSGTDDRLTAASTLVVGAAALGRRVDVLLQFWGLEAFRGDGIREPHGVDAAAPAGGAARFEQAHLAHWADVLSQAKEVGEVSIHACAQSMEALGITPEQLDPLVDDVEGIAAFVAAAGGPVVVI